MLHGLTLGKAVRRNPEAVAVIDGDRRVTFAELDRRVERLAAFFAEKGFAAGDRIAFLLPNCLEFVELVLACSRTGVIFIPLNVRYTAEEMDLVIADAAPRGLVLHPALAKPTRTAEWQITLGADPWPDSSHPAPKPFYDPDAVLGLFYTSGTTGRAKGVMLTHTNVWANYMNSYSLINYRPGDVFLQAAPMFHIASFGPSVLSGADSITQVMLPRFDLKSFCEAVQTHRASVTILIPTMINFLTLYPDLARYDLSSLTRIAYGGSPIASEILLRVREKLPHVKLFQGYGLTEAAPLITTLDDGDHAGARMASCGTAVRGAEVDLVDENGNPVADGERGEVVVRGQNVMRGYWNQPAETANSFFGTWLRTGDIAWRDAEGFYYIVDRRKDMIVTGGENVYSSEVESVLYSHPAVKEAAVIGVPDERWGEAVMACVVLRDGSEATAADLESHCRVSLANYKLPRRFEIVAGELPKSGTGKILKRKLREPHWTNAARGVN